MGSTYSFTPVILQPHTTGALTLLISEVVVSPKPLAKLRTRPKRKRAPHPDAKPKSKKPVPFNKLKADELS